MHPKAAFHLCAEHFALRTLKELCAGHAIAQMCDQNITTQMWIEQGICRMHWWAWENHLIQRLLHNYSREHMWVKESLFFLRRKWQHTNLIARCRDKNDSKLEAAKWQEHYLRDIRAAFGGALKILFDSCLRNRCASFLFKTWESLKKTRFLKKKWD